MVWMLTACTSVSLLKSGVTSNPPPVLAMKTHTINDTGGVTGLMEKADATAENGEKKFVIQYAEMACEAQEIEAKILSGDELSKLEQRQEEIERLTENDSSEQDMESKMALLRKIIQVCFR